jgi:predicted aspartyl protease
MNKMRSTAISAFAAISRLVASVDYGTNRLTLARPRITDADTQATRAPSLDTELQRPGINIPVRTTASGFLSGEVRIDGITRPLNFIIDTGATVTVLSERAASWKRRNALSNKER